MSRKPVLSPVACAIFRCLALGGRWSVAKLAEQWKCSEQTIRNHLPNLEVLGLAHRYPAGMPTCWERNGGNTVPPLPDAWVAIDPRGTEITDPTDIIGDPS